MTVWYNMLHGPPFCRVEVIRADGTTIVGQVVHPIQDIVGAVKGERLRAHQVR